jgi:CBS domain-containing protein
MRIREVMSSPVVTVTPDTTVKQATGLLVERGFSALPTSTGRGLLSVRGT